MSTRHTVEQDVTEAVGAETPSTVTAGFTVAAEPEFSSSGQEPEEFDPESEFDDAELESEAAAAEAFDVHRFREAVDVALDAASRVRPGAGVSRVHALAVTRATGGARDTLAELRSELGKG